MIDSLMAGLTSGYDPRTDVGSEPESFGWDVEPEPEPRTVAPDVVRFIPTSALAEANNEEASKTFADRANAELADEWARVHLEQIDLDAEKWVTSHAEYKDVPTGDADRGIGLGTQPMMRAATNGLMGDTQISAKAPENAYGTGNLPLDLLNKNIINPIRDFNANQGPEADGPPSALNAAAVLGGWLPFGQTGKGAGKAAHELVGPGADAIELAFNAAPAKGAGLMEQARGVLSGIERQMTDRFSDLNKLGKSTESLVANMGGANEGALQRVADDLGPAYQAVQEDLPKLNKLVGLQNYIEEAVAKGREGPATSAESDEFARMANLISTTAKEIGDGKWGKNRNEAIGDALTAIRDIHPSMLAEVRRALASGGLAGFRDAAKAAQALVGRGGAGGLRSTTEARQMLANLEAEVGPERWLRIQEADTARRVAVNNLRDDLEESGIIAPELIELFKAERADYNPVIYTQFLEKLADGTAGRTMRQMSNTVKKLSELGGTDEQLPPMQALTKAIMDGDMAIRRNNVVRAAVADGGFKAEKMPLTFTTGPITKRESGDAVGELGTVVKRQTPRDLSGYVYFMKDGVPMRAEVPPVVEKAMNGLTSDQLTTFQRVGEFINRSLRLGATTLNPSFLLSNMTSDYLTSMVREGLLPQEVAKGYLDVLTRSPSYKSFIRGGGGFGDMGGYFTAPTKAMGLADIEKSITAGGGGTVHNLAELNKLTQAIASGDGKAVVKELARLGPLRDAGEVIEKGPRVAAYKKSIGEGATEAEATMSGRRVTVDFNRAGQFMKTANAWIPFLNPAFQGGMNLGRSLRDDPKAKFRAAGISAAAIGTYLYNRQFGAAYDDIPDFEKNRGIVLMLPGAVKNEDGPGFKSNPHIMIPIRDLAAFTLPVEAVLRKWDGHDPQLLDVLANTALALNPLPSVLDPGSMMPAPIREAMAQESNYDTFRGRPIVSRGKEDLPPEMQYGDRTSELAKALGAKLKLSPDRIDHFVEGLTAGAGTKVMQAASQLMGQESDRPPVLGGLLSGVYRTYGGQIQNDLYKKADGIYNEHRDEALEIVRSSRDYEAATPDEKLRMVRSADTALRTAVNESVGIEKAEKDYGLPDRYRGVASGSALEADITKALNVAEDKRSFRERSLADRYEGLENPGYAREVKARAAASKNTNTQVRDLVGVGR